MEWRDLIEFRAPYQTAYFKNTNIRVLRIMLCLANGWTEAQILVLHPELNLNHLQACMKYGEACLNPNSDPQIDPQLIDIVLKTHGVEKQSSNSSSHV